MDFGTGDLHAAARLFMMGMRNEASLTWLMKREA